MVHHHLIHIDKKDSVGGLGWTQEGVHRRIESAISDTFLANRLWDVSNSYSLTQERETILIGSLSTTAFTVQDWKIPADLLSAGIDPYRRTSVWADVFNPWSRKYGSYQKVQINPDFLAIHITLLSVVGPHDIIVRCWEFSPNMSLLV